MTAVPNMRVDERVRFLAGAMGIVFLVAWISWFGPFDDLLDGRGTPLGADFSMFYTAGRIVSEGRSELLYDQATHQQQLRQLFPGLSPDFCLPYRYPPHVAVVLAPLSQLGYLPAWLVFTCGSLGSLAIAVLGLRAGTVPSLSSGWLRGAAWERTATIALVGWPVVWETIAGGQASLYALGIAVGAAWCLTRERPVMAGCCLALAVYKPNVLLLWGLGLIVRQPRLLWGAIPTALALVTLGSVAGVERFAEYATLSTRLSASEWDVATPFWKVHGLAPAFAALVPLGGRAVCVGVGAVLAVVIGWAWRRWERRSNAVRPAAFASLLVVNSLFNPYCPIYDLVLLGAAAWWYAEAVRHLQVEGAPLAMSPFAVQSFLALLFFGPHFSQALARGLGFQVFPWMLMAMAAYAARRLVARPLFIAQPR